MNDWGFSGLLGVVHQHLKGVPNPEVDEEIRAFIADADGQVLYEFLVDSLACMERETREYAALQRATTWIGADR